MRGQPYSSTQQSTIATLKEKEKLVTQMINLYSLELVEHEKKLEIDEGLEEIPLNEKQFGLDNQNRITFDQSEQRSIEISIEGICRNL